MIFGILLILGIFGTTPSFGLDNGLALTPPMGWMHWQRFRCEIDCVKYPTECISEKLFMDMADRMVSDGYLKAGYEYIIVDDCWSDKKRDEYNRLQSDPIRFPSGMKALADYVHNLGLKFGMYGDYGTYTCGGYPGSIDYLELDAQTFADWDVDYIKLDGCYSEPSAMDEGYEEFGRYLNKTGRPMVYSCSWPAYQELNGMHSNYTALSRVCNLWRNYGDIEDSYSSVINIASWFAGQQNRIAEFSAPGHWNDPDMLIIGNYGLSIEQSKAQMTIWSLMAAPMIMSNDLRNIRPEFADILLNADAIKINQDPRGIQGLLTATSNSIDVWVKPVLPGNSLALGFISRRQDGVKYAIDFTLEQLGLTNTKGYKFVDIFEDQEWSVGTNTISVRIPPSGAIFLKAISTE